MVGTKGTAEINKNWPQDSGTGDDEKHEGRVINLVAEGINGVKSCVPQKERVLI